jgi:hypothetical protein
MKKHILIAATAALLVSPNPFSTILADPPETPVDAGMHHRRFSAEDFAVFTDARIASLKSDIRLKPTQEKKWFALEAVLREQAKIHAARAAESRQKAEEPHEHHDMIEGLQERAKQLEAKVELKTLADAPSHSTKVWMMHKNAASSRFCASM